MKKTFKKSIAVLLAVLMVVLSVPFTALAAPGDYSPNINLEFGAVSNIMGTGLYAGEGAYDCNTTSKNSEMADSMGLAGMYGVPVDYDVKAGTLTLKAAKTEAFAATYEMEPATEDYTYGVGDYFIVTVTCENIDQVRLVNARLVYSDNIEPAGVYGYNATTKRAYAIRGLSDLTGLEKAETVPGAAPIGGQGATDFYTESGNSINQVAGDMSEFDADKRSINVLTVGDQATCTAPALLQSDPDAPFFSPVDGSAGYNYENTLILNSYMFKITGEGPIVFDLLDKYNNVRSGYEGCYYIARSADGLDPSQYTTYAINTYGLSDLPGTAGESDVNCPNRNPGSTKMSFLGTNVNWATTPDVHEHSFDGAVPVYNGDGTHTLTCTAADCDKSEGYQKTVDCTPVSADNAVEPGCETDGKAADTICDVCKGTITEGAKKDAIGHSYTAVNKNAEQHTFVCANNAAHNYDANHVWGTDVTTTKEPTYTDPGEGYVVCTECNAQKTVEIPAKTHEHTGGTATCVAKAVCTICGEAYGEVDANNHANVVTDPETASSCTVAGKTEGSHCAACNTVIVAQQDKELAAHVGGTATCVDKAVCDNCGQPYGEVDANNHANVVTDPETASSCTVAGKTEGSHCAACNTVIVAQQDKPLAAHVGGEATCIAQAVCDNCGQPYGEVNPENHKNTGLDESTAVVPTFDADGKEADLVCFDCHKTLETGKKINKLVGYTVTIDSAYLGMGTVTLDGETVPVTGKAVKLEAGSVVKLEATPLDGAEFLGWTINGKTTVKDAAMNATVLANITYTPVFAIAEEGEFTVTFVDGYGNIVSTATVTDAADITVPAAPARPGYTAATENGWSMTNEQIAALTADATISAQYVKNEEVLYTVTAPEGAVITVDGEDKGATALVPFDTKVTVTKAGTQAWTINGVNVGYGDSYTFFVTANVELGTAAAVKATPSVAAISQEEVVSGGLTKVMFTATRTMADGYTYINSGFVYGKGDLGAITLDNVDGRAVKAVYNKTASEQFSLTYGLSAQSGTMTVRAFLVYADETGARTEVYAEGPLTTYTYR